ncbi:MAG: 50S ribosomal protein L15 [Methanomassiliicoccales archaeon]|nr:MAG: 50S ribosomal protein L15 [Methanomassiliicoccales archaeon]
MGRTRKLRGNRTHGRGKKAGRGAGLRGGRGNAGLHKHKYMSTIKFDPDHFGRHGFKRHPSLTKRKKTINIAQIEENLDELMRKGVAKKEKETIKIDLTSLGVEKLLGGGSATRKMRIIVPEATSRAESKIVEAGGSIDKQEE